ncbi:echinoderm microtubule-associated protein-like 3 isoform X9 [Nomascus leucogenys]|uniref:echinoderm microtubule-associated protein-like 3 isoform X9 n=1 Tax=Nomascus leucogenys TaxID=61853 RepID=UPI00122DBDD0|nr:echinoderm microtubule-associated protein-like 3 isoform X9 [Nomascus leucogenys]
MVLPVFAEAETAAGRELCQVSRLPCQKEALDPLPPSPPLWTSIQAWGCLKGAVLLDTCEGPAREALQSLSQRLRVQEQEMELVKAALAEALRLLRLQVPPSSLQGSGTPAPPGDSSLAAPPGLPPTCTPSLVSRGTQTETEVELKSSPGPPGLSNGPPAPQGASEEPSGTQSEGGGSSSSGAGSPGPPGILRPLQPPQRADTAASAEALQEGNFLRQPVSAVREHREPWGKRPPLQPWGPWISEEQLQFGLAVHPDGVRVASGQTAGVDKDGKPLQPVVHIWDSETLLKLQEIGLGAFERGVGALAFSAADQGAFLCVVDDSNEHMLSVWDCSRGMKLAEIKSTNDSVLAVGFNPRDSSCIVTSGKSHVHFWNWSGGVGVPGNGTLTRKQGVFGKYKKPKFIPCFVFLPDGDILTGDSEGNILTWGRSPSDSKTPGRGGAKETYGIVAQAHAHEGSIFALCLRRDGTVLSGGGRDRRLVQWGPGLVALREAEIPEHFGAVRAIAEGLGSELLVGTTKNALLRGDLAQGFSPVIQGHTDELWGLCTHPSQNRFLTCGHDRQLCLWDGESHALAWSIDLKETGLCADFHPSGAVVAVGLNTGRWLVLDTETREIVSDVIDGNEQLSVVRYSPDGLYLAIGSHDNVIYIYSVSSDGAKSSRFGRCMGHSSFITHLDWSKDGNFIMSNSGDYEILYWDVAGGCKQLKNRYESRDREWATYTCVLGFHVYGVWPDGSDGTDINSLCRSHNERVVAVADDFCKVHLFQYPCARAKAPSRMYGGHGSHVTSVRFTHDDSHLVSLGGKDASIFQWRVLGAGGAGPAPATPSRTPSLSPASSLDV